MQRFSNFGCIIKRKFVSSGCQRNFSASIPRADSALYDPYSLGYGASFVYDSLVYMHHTIDLPWWGCIVGATVAGRFVFTMPVAIWQQRRLSKIRQIQEAFKPWQKKLLSRRLGQNSRPDRSSVFALVQVRKETKAALGKAYTFFNCKPGATILLPYIQIPFFVITSLTLRSMTAFPMPFLETAAFPYPGFEVGGALWFSDLTVPDPSWIFGSVTGVANFVTLNLNMSDSPNKNSVLSKALMYIGRGVTVASIPIAISLPSALSLYWATSALFGLGQALCFRYYRALKRRSTSPEIKDWVKLHLK